MDTHYENTILVLLQCCRPLSVLPELLVVDVAREKGVTVEVAREKVVTVEVARKMVVVLVEEASEVLHVDTSFFSCCRQPQICIWGSSCVKSDTASQ